MSKKSTSIKNINGTPKSRYKQKNLQCNHTKSGNSLETQIDKNEKEIEKDIVFKLINKCIEAKWYANCLSANIILSELFNKYNIQNNVKKGFKLISDSHCKYALWHCWIETNDNIYDISSCIASECFSDLKKQCEDIKEELSEVLPKNFERVDMDNQEEREALLLNEKAWKIYKENSGNFWGNVQRKCKRSEQKNVQSWDWVVSFRNSMLDNI